MENPKICDCPYIDWCHEIRQWLQDNYRKKSSNKKVQDCDFYKYIQEKESTS